MLTKNTLVTPGADFQRRAWCGQQTSKIFALNLKPDTGRRLDRKRRLSWEEHGTELEVGRYVQVLCDREKRAPSEGDAEVRTAGGKYQTESSVGIGPYLGALNEKIVFERVLPLDGCSRLCIDIKGGDNGVALVEYDFRRGSDLEPCGGVRRAGGGSPEVVENVVGRTATQFIAVEYLKSDSHPYLPSNLGRRCVRTGGHDEHEHRQEKEGTFHLKYLRCEKRAVICLNGNTSSGWLLQV